ncbi:MAG: hypothetical protein EHM89_01625 [Acidobacteria bacterium]|nr:MAG: hypothetical protein EHM89_01625 [Acidobacteriota bacterium]
MRHVLQELIASVTPTHSTDLGCKACVALAVLFLSCSAMPPAHDEARLTATQPAYSLVFIIHGDGDYLYHDTLGNARRADEDILSKAQAIAARNPNAEVFLFHEIERRHVLFLIPRRDGHAYYYRNGRLVAQKSYWRDQGASRFDPEVRLYEQFAATQPRPPLLFFFYFGHEIPEFNGAGYDASYSKRRVTIDDLAEGVKSFVADSTKIDVLALATCFGGTPYTIGALAPYARYIIASPDNLHLSYFDLEPLASLDAGSGDNEVAGFADRFARNAFEQLANEVQTTVSVVVYDVNGVGDFIDSVAGVYDRTVTAANRMSTASVEHCDCADDSAYALPGMSDGLTVFYRAPRFGRGKYKPDHSGWECWRIAE